MRHHQKAGRKKEERAKGAVMILVPEGKMADFGKIVKRESGRALSLACTHIMRIVQLVAWSVIIPSRVAKQIRKTPKSVSAAIELLIYSLAESGPVRREWPHYGKITGWPKCHHCHIQRGRPTYVAVWRETGPQEIEVTYVGTHEGAVYGRLC